MKQPTQVRIEHWKKSREKGIARFILMRGILLWGLPLGLGFAIYKQFFQDDMTGWKIQLPIWTLAGIVFGVLLWYVEGKMFSKYLTENKSRPPS